MMVQKSMHGAHWVSLANGPAPTDRLSAQQCITLSQASGSKREMRFKLLATNHHFSLTALFKSPLPYVLPDLHTWTANQVRSLGIHHQVVGVLAQVHVPHTSKQEPRNGILICDDGNQGSLWGHGHGGGGEGLKSPAGVTKSPQQERLMC
eukprot:1139139-Pelagomonas_calceolata.AAC.1